MRATLLPAFLSLCLVACSGLPRDAESTLDNARERGHFRAGLVSGHADGLAQGRLYLANLSQRIGARPQLIEGNAEALLLQLEKGEIDVVVGLFAQSSPWQSRVHMLPARRGDQNRPALVQVAARRGENAWIGLLHRTSSEAGVAR